MKKDIKKNDKKKLKDYLKKYALLTLNVFCYICTAIFVISLIVGACSKPKQSPKLEKPVSTMILRDRIPVYNYPVNDTPYRSLEDINIVDNASWVIKGHYGSDYIYYNPTFLDVNTCMSSYLLVGEYAYVPIKSDFKIGSSAATHIFLYHSSSTQYVMGLLFSNNYLDWTCRFDVSNQYITIANPSYFTQFFVESGAIFGWNSLSGVPEYNKQFCRFLAYFYSTRSFADFSYQFDNNPIEAITPYLGTETLNNGFFFYNQTAYEYLVELGSFDYTFDLTLFEGGFSCNGRYYDSCSMIIQSAYNTDNQHRNYYLSGSYPGNIDSDRITDSTNSSLRGYFFISSIYFEKAYRVTTSQGSGWAYEKTEVFSRQRSTSTGIEYVYYEVPEWRSSIYQYLTVGYITYREFDFSPFDTIASGSSPMTYIVNSLGKIVPIVPSTPDGEDYPMFFDKVFSWLTYAFYGVLPILSFTILPGISLGVVLLVPFVITLILFVVRLFKR